MRDSTSKSAVLCRDSVDGVTHVPPILDRRFVASKVNIMSKCCEFAYISIGVLLFVSLSWNKKMRPERFFLFLVQENNVDTAQIPTGH